MKSDGLLLTFANGFTFAEQEIEIELLTQAGWPQGDGRK